MGLSGSYLGLSGPRPGQSLKLSGGNLELSGFRAAALENSQVIETNSTIVTSGARIVQRPPCTCPWGTSGARELNVRVCLGKSTARELFNGHAILVIATLF